MSDKPGLYKGKVAVKYNDPAADVLLICEEGAFFHVSSFYLKAFSGFFRDMLLNPALDSSGKADGGNKDDAIPFPHSFQDVSLFLDLIHDKVVTEKANFAQYDRIITMCERYECHIVIERIAYRLRKIVKQAPWSIFCLASHLDDSDLAIMALKVMSQDVTMKGATLRTLKLADIEQCTLPYFLGILASAASANPHYGIYGGQTFSWSHIAEDFKPITQ